MAEAFALGQEGIYHRCRVPIRLFGVLRISPTLSRNPRRSRSRIRASGPRIPAALLEEEQPSTSSEPPSSPAARAHDVKMSHDRILAGQVSEIFRTQRLASIPSLVLHRTLVDSRVRGDAWRGSEAAWQAADVSPFVQSRSQMTSPFRLFPPAVRPSQGQGCWSAVAVLWVSLDECGHPGVSTSDPCR